MAVLDHGHLIHDLPKVRGQGDLQRNRGRQRASPALLALGLGPRSSVACRTRGAPSAPTSDRPDSGERDGHGSPAQNATARSSELRSLEPASKARREHCSSTKAWPEAQREGESRESREWAFGAVGPGCICHREENRVRSDGGQRAPTGRLVEDLRVLTGASICKVLL